MTKVITKGKAHLGCLTQFTREQMESKSNPSRNMTNYKAIQQAERKRRYEAEQKKAKQK